MGILSSRRRRLVAAALLVGAAYPSFVLGYTWKHVAEANLPGGRNGPLDAYRHTLASALVAYTLNPVAVDWVTSVMEGAGTDANLMDRHNNRIGSGIGARAASFASIEPAVRARIDDGTIDASDADQVTWLPETRWARSRWW